MNHEYSNGYHDDTREAEPTVEIESQQPAYLLIDPETLVNFCRNVYRETPDKDDLLTRGTLPREAKEQLWNYLDPTDIPSGPYTERFESRPVLLNGWMEYFSLSCAALYLNYKWKDVRAAHPVGTPLETVRFMPAVGLEGKYLGKEKEEEELLGDGVLFRYPVKTAFFVQECKLQNRFGKGKREGLNAEAVRVINNKIAKRSRYPEQCILLISMLNSTEAQDENFSFKNIIDNCPDIHVFDLVLFISYTADEDIFNATVYEFQAKLDAEGKVDLPRLHLEFEM